MWFCWFGPVQPYTDFLCLHVALFHDSNLIYDLIIWHLSVKSEQALKYFLSINFRTAHCSFRIGPIMIADEPFTVSFHSYIYNWEILLAASLTLFSIQIDNGLMTPTMKIRRDKVTAKYQREIEALFKWGIRNWSTVFLRDAHDDWSTAVIRNWEHIQSDA